MRTVRVYCAGPLFNQKEREEMALIAETLEVRGYTTFLPQRDGLELTKCVEGLVASGMALVEANALMVEAVFSLDVYEILHGCNVLVANLNGRVPDEGTVSEAAIAWSRGKPLVGYKADSRSAFGGQDNPLVTGLFRFQLAQSMEELADAVDRETARAQDVDVGQEREAELEESLRLGRRISALLEKTRRIDDLVLAMREFRSSAVT